MTAFDTSQAAAQLAGRVERRPWLRGRRPSRPARSGSGLRRAACTRGAHRAGSACRHLEDQSAAPRRRARGGADPAAAHEPGNAARRAGAAARRRGRNRLPLRPRSAVARRGLHRRGGARRGGQCPRGDRGVRHPLHRLVRCAGALEARRPAVDRDPGARRGHARLAQPRLRATRGGRRGRRAASACVAAMRTRTAIPRPCSRRWLPMRVRAATAYVRATS